MNSVRRLRADLVLGNRISLAPLTVPSTSVILSRMSEFIRRKRNAAGEAGDKGGNPDSS